MSEMSKKARAAMRAKANRMGSGGSGRDPSRKVDASGWTPPEPLNTTAKTGARPVRARIYKSGGKVQGDRGPLRADRKRRASGGSVVDDYINRDGVKANAKLGKPHEGAYKKGGRAHRDMGGAAGMPVPQARMAFNPVGGPRGMMGGLKKGGAAKHSDEAADKKLVKQMVEKSALKRKDGGKAEKSGTYFGGTRPTGGRMPKASGGSTKHGADCTCARCRGGRAERADGGSAKYSNYDTDAESQAALKNAWSKQSKPEYATSQPVPKSEKRGGRAERAKGGEIKGKTSSGDSYNYEGLTDKQRGLAQRLGGANPERKSAVRTKEDVERTARASGGRAKKGKTNINIHINTPQGQPNAMPMPPMGMPMKPPQTPLPMPTGGPGGAPPMGLAGGPPPGGPPMPPGGMPRKSGGRTNGMVPMHAGAGSGLGRLEKTKIQENSRR